MATDLNNYFSYVTFSFCFVFFSTQVKLLFFFLYIIFELAHSQESNDLFVYIARMATLLSFRGTGNIRISQTVGNGSWLMSDNIQ